MLFINYNLHIISYGLENPFILLPNKRNLKMNLVPQLGCCTMKHKSLMCRLLYLSLRGKKLPDIAQSVSGMALLSF